MTLLGFALATLLIELLLHALPVSTGYRFSVVDARHPIVHGTPHFRYVYSRDWNFHLENAGVLNNFGYRSSYDYVPHSGAVAIVGNSFIQADAVDPSDSLAERMAALLHRPVYGIGVDGFSLADYSEAARWASETFDSGTILVLLTPGDLVNSCVPRDGEHYLREEDGRVMESLVERPSPSPVKQWLNELKIFRYLYDNLHAAHNWAKGWERSDPGLPESNGSAAAPKCATAQFQAAATEFLLAAFKSIEALHRARVVFLLSPGNRREHSAGAREDRDIDRFAQRAARDGFQVVRFDAEFAAALHAGTRLDFLPIDGHWNASAYAIAARAAAAAIAADLDTGARISASDGAAHAAPAQAFDGCASRGCRISALRFAARPASSASARSDARGD